MVQHSGAAARPRALPSLPAHASDARRRARSAGGCAAVPSVRQGQSVWPHEHKTLSQRRGEEVDRIPAALCHQPVCDWLVIGIWLKRLVKFVESDFMRFNSIWLRRTVCECMYTHTHACMHAHCMHAVHVYTGYAPKYDVRGDGWGNICVNCTCKSCWLRLLARCSIAADVVW